MTTPERMGAARSRVALDRDGSAVPVRARSATITAAIPTGEQAELVWGPLRDAWLTWRIASRRDLHVKGGYRWDPTKYAPVFLVDEDGRPVLAFER